MVLARFLGLWSILLLVLFFTAAGKIGVDGTLENAPIALEDRSGDFLGHAAAVLLERQAKAKKGGPFDGNGNGHESTSISLSMRDSGTLLSTLSMQDISRRKLSTAGDTDCTTGDQATTCNTGT